MDRHQPTPSRGQKKATRAVSIEPQDTKAGLGASAAGGGSTKPKPKAQSTLPPFLPPPVIGGAWVREQQSLRDAREAQALGGTFTAPAMASGQPIRGCAITVGSLLDPAPEAGGGGGGDDDVDISSFVNLDPEERSS